MYIKYGSRNVKLLERISVLETKEKERNMELQEFKERVDKRLDIIQSDVKDGFKESRETMGKIFDRIEELRKWLMKKN